MKKILVFLAIITVALSCANKNRIGVIDNDKFVVTYDTAKLLEKANAILKQSGMAASLNQIAIVEDKVQNTDETYYMLLATNAAGNIKLATDIKLEGKEFVKDIDSIFIRSCTCIGCENNCSPRLYSEEGSLQWMCTPCDTPTGCEKNERVNF